ncbi:MAG: MerR family DNA-binding transcriptional regulator [Gemmatimonadetes bacterium]|nr:MerR family DNA-binding transcriptional regulator [Gemmatimonadota bacterium]
MNTRRPQKFTLSIGDVARRTGFTTSALRSYEKKALIGLSRTSRNQRC